MYTDSLFLRKNLEQRNLRNGYMRRFYLKFVKKDIMEKLIVVYSQILFRECLTINIKFLIPILQFLQICL